MSSVRRICLFGTYDETRHPRIGIIGDGFAAHGRQIIRCNTPWKVGTAGRVTLMRRPWRAVGALIGLVRLWRKLWKAGADVGDIDAVVVGYLAVLDVHIARRRFPEATVVLDHLAPVAGTLSDRGYPRGLRFHLASRIDRSAVRAADVVIVDTDEHQTSDGDVVVPVGAADAWFEAGDRRRSPPDPGPLRVIFFGLFTPLQGAPIIAEAVRHCLQAGTELELTMVGQGQDHAAARRVLAGQPSVNWRPWIDPAGLPKVVAAHDVCLGIFGTTPKAARVVPNKVYQGLAAGCVVVTSDTAPQRRLLGDSVRYVRPGDATALAATLREFASDPTAIVRDRVHASQRRDDFRAREVVRPLLAALDVAGSSGGPDRSQ